MNTGLIENEMKFISNQVRISARRLDLLTLDHKKNLCGIELKNKKPDRSIIKQCNYYLENCKPLERLIVIAPDYTKNIAKQLLTIEKIELMSYRLENDKIIINTYSIKEEIPTKKIITSVAPIKKKVKDINPNNVFGEELRRLRQNNDLTVRELEALSGVSHSYLSQMEVGARGIPKPDILRKLADPLKISYNELLIISGYIESFFNPETS